MASESATKNVANEIADAMPHIVWSHDVNGTATYFNRKWTEYTGSDLAQTVASGAESFMHPDDRARVLEQFLAAREPGSKAGEFDATYRIRRHDGEYRWHVARVVPVRNDAGGLVAFVGTAIDVDEQRRVDQENRFLVDATRILGSSLDVTKTLEDIGRLVVPGLADWFAIDLLDDDGKLQRATVVHSDPKKVQLAWDLWERQKPQPEDPNGVYEVMRTKQPQHFEDIPDSLLEQVVTDKELLAIMRSLGLRSSICVPLLVRDRPIGALTVVAEKSGRRYEKRDVAFAEEFARRVAIAIDNARLYEEMTRARSAAEAVAREVVEQSKAVEAALLTMRKERDEAVARLKAVEAGTNAR